MINKHRRTQRSLPREVTHFESLECFAVLRKSLFIAMFRTVLSSWLDRGQNGLCAVAGGAKFFVYTLNGIQYMIWYCFAYSQDPHV